MKSFTLTPEDYEKLVTANKPDATMSMDFNTGITVIQPKSVLARVTKVWQELAPHYGVLVAGIRHVQGNTFIGQEL